MSTYFGFERRPMFGFGVAYLWEKNYRLFTVVIAVWEFRVEFVG